MKIDGGDVVALGAILANFMVTWATLRHQRKGAHQGRVWDRRLAAYEGYVDQLVQDMKAL